jgi:hypothetical protein
MKTLIIIKKIHQILIQFIKTIQTLISPFFINIIIYCKGKKKINNILHILNTIFIFSHKSKKK